jgi:hypothetical protein
MDFALCAKSRLKEAENEFLGNRRIWILRVQRKIQRRTLAHRTAGEKATKAGFLLDTPDATH